MNSSGTSFLTTRNVVYLAILTALLVVLNLLSVVFKVITNINLTLIPIVIGALLLGIRGGLILGSISGIMTFVFGVTGVDAFTNYLFINHPVLTFLTCTVKIIAAAVLGAVVYNLLKDKNKYLATFLAAATVPIVNTFIFIVGALTMYGTFFVLSAELGVSVMYYLIILCAGLNFLIELGINLVVAPAIHTVIRVLEKA